MSKALAVGPVIARPPEILRADGFFPPFIAGLETVLSTRGHALLLELIDDRDLSPAELPDARLVVRGSTGPAPQPVRHLRMEQR